MKHAAIVLPLVLAACPSPSPSGNPAVLYLAPKDGEIEVELTGTEPGRY